MPTLSPEQVWKIDERYLQDFLNSGALTPVRKQIRFYAPSFTYYKSKHFHSSPTDFPTISITGTACALNCKHCGGKVLETMHSAISPDKLFESASKLKREGSLGFLVSGGCLPDGSVPLKPFIPTLKKIKRELGLTVFVHTGVINQETAGSLKEAGVDAALMDIVGSDETIKKTFNMSISVKDYEDSLKAMHDSGLNFVPHVIIGLNEGKLSGELKALQMIRPFKPSALVIIAFMPIHGTEMEKTNSPAPIDIARVTAVARLLFPQTPLVLGCMRPKGKQRVETDVLVLKAGADAITFPSNEAVDYAKGIGYKTTFSSYCCAQMYLDAVAKKF